MFDPVDIAVQLEKHLGSPKQTWLLGAGVSFRSNIPLMAPLTDRVLHVARTERYRDDEESTRVIDFLQADVAENANIEDILTHLGDLISMAERSRRRRVIAGREYVTRDKLVEIHGTLLHIISETVRWGYKPPRHGPDGNVIEEEAVGVAGAGIVELKEHLSFMKAIFGATRAGLEGIRSPVEFFTTNYDTLLEDALALNEITYQDGFSGGGVAFWNKRNLGFQSTTRAVVTKLHGSIDWYRPLGDPTKLYRVRWNDNYSGNGGGVMIYPQATKYIHAQSDPFAELFQRFRHTLASGTDQVLLTCGYSFGDQHINAEIENALSTPRNQLTLVAFSEGGAEGLPEPIERWRENPVWGKQIFVAGSRGIYQGSSEAVFGREEGGRDWWTFGGVAKLLSEGFPSDVVEQIQ